MPIDTRFHEPKIVVIAASAGGIRALTTILSMLPPDFPAPIVIVQHRSLAAQSFLTSILARATRLKVAEAEQGEPLEPGTVYVARPDRHLTVTRLASFAYVDGRRIRHLLSSANPLFSSSADVFGSNAVAVVLTGTGHDGTDGVQAIKARGGTVIVQNEATSEHFSMPHSAIESGAVDIVLPLNEIAAALVNAVTGPPVDTQV